MDGEQVNSGSDANLLDSFKMAANSVALLYKDALSQSRRAYSTGYMQCLQDMLEVIDEQSNKQRATAEHSAANISVSHLLSFINSRKSQIEHHQRSNSPLTAFVSSSGGGNLSSTSLSAPTAPVNPFDTHSSSSQISFQPLHGNSVDGNVQQPSVVSSAASFSLTQPATDPEGASSSVSQSQTFFTAHSRSAQPNAFMNSNSASGDSPMKRRWANMHSSDINATARPLIPPSTGSLFDSHDFANKRIRCRKDERMDE